MLPLPSATRALRVSCTPHTSTEKGNDRGTDTRGLATTSACVCLLCWHVTTSERRHCSGRAAYRHALDGLIQEVNEPHCVTGPRLEALPVLTYHPRKPSDETQMSRDCMVSRHSGNMEMVICVGRGSLHTLHDAETHVVHTVRWLLHPTCTHSNQTHSTAKGSQSDKSINECRYP